MSGEPHQLEEAREAIERLLGRLHPEPTAEWIKERTNHLLRQFGERGSDDSPTKPSG